MILGVAIGGCMLAGLLAAAARFPSVAMLLVSGAAEGFVLWPAYVGLQTGITVAKRSGYARRSNPWGFWFYIVFYIFIGTVVLGYPTYAFIHRRTGRLGVEPAAEHCFWLKEY